MQKELIKAGDGSYPQKGQSVTVHCTGVVESTGKKFWSTKDKGQSPFTFNIGLGQVIRGWDEGVMKMKIGEISKIHCSPEYGYGAGGFPQWGIPPNAALCFEIELLSLK